MPRTIIGTGFLGGYTTFSTLMFESVRLFEDGSRYESLVNIIGSLAAGLAAAAAGLALARDDVRRTYGVDLRELVPTLAFAVAANWRPSSAIRTILGDSQRATTSAPCGVKWMPS
jgi:hypothetical protein